MKIVIDSCQIRFPKLLVKLIQIISLIGKLFIYQL